MSEFEKWFKTTEAYKMMEEQNYFKMNLFFFVTARNQYSHSGVQVAYLTWQHQQAEIDRLSSVLDERTKEWLQAIECGTYFENVAKPLKAENDNLKAQLNNMEACYIQVKKERDELQVRASELLEGVESAMVQLNHWTTAYEILNQLRGGDQKIKDEVIPEPKWTTIKVVCQKCGHYLNGCHCNHFGDQCPHLNTSMFGDNGLAECFNCNKIINKDREVVGDVDDINLTR